MAIDPVIPRSRRAVLAAGIGGIAATVLHAVGRPEPAAAANGDPVAAGGTTTATLVTNLQQTNDTADGLAVSINVNGGVGTALVGAASDGIAVRGQNSSSRPTISATNTGALNAGPALFAVAGTSGTVPSSNVNSAVYAAQTDSVGGRYAVLAESAGSGNTAIYANGAAGTGLLASGAVVGVLADNWAGGTALLAVSSGSDGAPAPLAKVGVFGYANQDATARAVYGKSPMGTAVQGDSDTGIGLRGKSASNTGLRGDSTTGTAIRALSVSGRAINASTGSTTTPALSSQVTSSAAGVKSAIQGYVGAGALPAGSAETGVQGRCDVSENAIGLLGESASGTAVRAVSTSGRAINATSASATLPAVTARNTGTKSAIQGFAGPGILPPPSAATGVEGRCDIASGIGVLGQSKYGVGLLGNTDNGYGVFGSGYYGVYGTGAAGVVGDVNAGTGVQGWTGVAFAPTPVANVGVWAGAENGRTALQVSGVAKFNRSGRVSFSSGQSSKKVIVAGGIVSGAFALATLQTNRAGIYVQAVVPAAADSSITIYLNKAVTATTAVGWIVVG